MKPKAAAASATPSRFTAITGITGTTNTGTLRLRVPATGELSAAPIIIRMSSRARQLGPDCPAPVPETQQPVQQLRAQEAPSTASARELAHEQLFSANLSVACAWDNLSLSSSSESSDPQPASPSSRKRKLSSPLFVACDLNAAAAAAASAAVATSGTTGAADKQCFSPSLQSPLTPPAAKRPCHQQQQQQQQQQSGSDRSAGSSPVSACGSGGGGGGWSPLRCSDRDGASAAS
ncbi:hypothetical protein BOX15_Mlig001585g2 [Macrostomum lignano]|uniref:Uncharacterized protein n=1 Tax=Macrostomum lignano TaxID=282301 RepID=A0A267E5P0_9PLAT|nr:hypothetical protein BOX15_Mlig001585g2 [Macrostomum lignano]